MRHLLSQIVDDETGAIISAEFIIIATIVVLALVTGWNAVSTTMVGELADVATAFGSLDQSYGYNSVTAVSTNGSHAHCSGSGFNDAGNSLALTSTTNSIAGGGGTTFITTGGGVSFVGGGDINFNGGGAGGAVVNGAVTAQGAGGALAVAPQAAAPTGVTTEGELVDREIISSEELVDVAPQVLGTRHLFDRPAPTSESRLQALSPKVAAVESDDECEVLKSRIRQLCDELQQLDAKTSTKRLQPQSVTPKSHGASQTVKPAHPKK